MRKAGDLMGLVRRNQSGVAIQSIAFSQVNASADGSTTQWAPGRRRSAAPLTGYGPTRELTCPSASESRRSSTPHLSRRARLRRRCVMPAAPLTPPAAMSRAASTREPERSRAPGLSGLAGSMRRRRGRVDSRLAVSETPTAVCRTGAKVRHARSWRACTGMSWTITPGEWLPLERTHSRARRPAPPP